MADSLAIITPTPLISSISLVSTATMTKTFSIPSVPKIAVVSPVPSQAYSHGGKNHIMLPVVITIRTVVVI